MKQNFSVFNGNEGILTSNEDGIIYLVPASTAPNLGAITSAQVAQAISTSNVASSLSTSGIASGKYVVYAVDESDHISAASAVISVKEATCIDLSSSNSGRVQLYPTNFKEILHIKSDIQVSSVTVHTLQGLQISKPIPGWLTLL